MGSRRFASRATRDLHLEQLVSPYPELGLVAANGPNDPEPELVVSEGVVTRMDGRDATDFDVIDRFVVAHGLDLDVATEAMALDDVELARRLVDVNVSRAELVRLSRGLTPAKLARVIGLLDPVELMLALKKLRARRAPGNQAHVTNLKESPALLAADAAEAARRGFAEMETTVGVARYAPLNALALLVGSQTGRPGVMTQCAVEERRNLELAIRGLVTYAETLSVYGTEPVFVDGDDTPWSKAFLGAAYASRGVKVRFTSGTGSEALMGYAQGMSMLYLEARCLAVVRAAGSQGVQNGSISCVALVLAVPGGTRAILGENVLAAWLDLEVASGNDAIASHSEIRKTAKLMGQFLPGTDFVTSGYSVMPRHDNTFGGGNFDADDLDEWLTIQRDWQVDAGIEPVAEDELLRVRERAARAVQAVFAELRLPPISDEEVAVATSGYDAREMPDRDRAADVEAADELLLRGVSGLDVALALDRAGFGDVAEAVLAMQRQRVSADYLQTSAVIDADGVVRSAVNDPNEYAGPGTGYRLEGERWELLQSLPHVVGADEPLGEAADDRPIVSESGVARAAEDETDVVVAVGPAFADSIRRTISGLDHRDVLDAVCEGVREGGGEPRLVRVRRVADVAFIAHDGARLSGSGVAIGLQSKGTAVIHRSDLQPLDNLELFGMSPLYTLESYRAMGCNAAGYALGQRVGPVPTQLDNFARAKLIVRTTLLHARETQAIVPGAEPVELELVAASVT
ncbi:MAG TPA: propanediol/glycerol family dehydratase large subunit [Gaiellaceae bacterium]|nr:propanediol/glycerol family dehydratase large subunit [Gaiellaceae bacterium]